MEDINPDDIIDMCVTKDGLALMTSPSVFIWISGQEVILMSKKH